MPSPGPTRPAVRIQHGQLHATLAISSSGVQYQNEAWPAPSGTFARRRLVFRVPGSPRPAAAPAGASTLLASVPAQVAHRHMPCAILDCRRVLTVLSFVPDASRSPCDSHVPQCDNMEVMFREIGSLSTGITACCGSSVSPSARAGSAAYQCGGPPHNEPATQTTQLPLRARPRNETRPVLGMSRPAAGAVRANSSASCDRAASARETDGPPASHADRACSRAHRSKTRNAPRSSGAVQRGRRSGAPRPPCTPPPPASDGTVP